jgi:hypothetical protein
MKYLSKTPFTAGANSKAYVDHWGENFGEGRKGSVPKDPDCGLDGKSAERPDGSPSVVVDLRTLGDMLSGAGSLPPSRVVLGKDWISFLSRLIGAVGKVSDSCGPWAVLGRRLRAMISLRREDRLPFVLNETEMSELSALLNIIGSLGRGR